MFRLTRHRVLMSAWALGLTVCMTLVGCSGGNNNDKIRIGSGQSGNPSTDATDYPIFYVKRATPDMTKADDNMRHVLICGNNKQLCGLNADLYMRDRASISANEHNVTARVRTVASEIWDVKDVDVAADGTKVIFAMRGPLKANQDPTDPPNWGIWEYVIATDDLHRVIVQDDLSGTGGQYVSPHYLPDGHILFASTRQTQSKAILLDELKPQFEAQDEDRREAAFVLHVMDANGQNIEQVSFNQSHDLSPSVLADGRVMFSRWDHAAGRNGIHLYTTNPDGTDTQLLYGSASHNTVPDLNPITNTTTYPAVQFTQAREMSNGNTLVLVRPFSGSEYGGDLYIVDTNTYVENTQATAANGGLAGPAQSKATPNNVRMLTGPSEGGRFVSAAPLWDGTNRILVSWSQCRVLDTDNTTIVPCTSDRLADATTKSAPPIYSVWMYNPADQTLQPVVVPTEGVMISDVAIAQPRTAPTYKPVSLSGDINVNSTLSSQSVGVLDIRSVYDFDGTVGGGITSIAAVADPTTTNYANRRARFLRIEKAVSLPDKDVRNVDFQTAFGVTGFMREILGYVPVEPDGSVQAKIPANVAFQISVVDANGRRVSNFPLHNAWITLRPGETVQCNGCHTPATNLTAGQSGISHGRSGLFAQAYAGAANAGSTFSNANASFAAVNVRDTMAETHAAWSCANEQCASITPSVNVAFADVWPVMPGSWDVTQAGCTTLSAATYSRIDSTCRTGDFKFVYTGGSGVPKIPTSSACLTTWSSTCRITINYPDHIQPIWDLARVTTDPMTNAVISDHTCTTCHNRVDAASAAQVAAGQLDLTNGTSDGSQQVNSYEELLRTHRQQQLNGAALEDICLVPAVDPVTGLVTGCTTFATVSPSLAARNAAASRFFTKFAAGGTHTTAGVSWLTSGELRLISEWVDIGAQYFNDPFKAPVN